MVALIPARAGSKRVPGKNMRLLGGKPLVQHTIDLADRGVRSGLFSGVEVWTDDPRVQRWVAGQAVVRCMMRAPSSDVEADVEWMRVWATRTQEESFALLRPTSPFRSLAMLQQAMKTFSSGVDSIRAVAKWTGPHPGKMWTYDRTCCRLSSVMDEWTASAPYHSSPTQSLVPVVYQTSSLEMGWTRNLKADVPTIAGDEIAAIFVEGGDAFAIDTEDDWQAAEEEWLRRQHPWDASVPLNCSSLR